MGCGQLLLAAMIAIGVAPAWALAEPVQPVLDAIRRALPPQADVTSAPFEDPDDGRLERLRIEFPRAGRSMIAGIRELKVDWIETEGMRLDDQGQFASARVVRLHGYELTGGPPVRAAIETVTIESAGPDVFGLLLGQDADAELSTGRLDIGGIAVDFRRGGRFMIESLAVDGIERGVASGLAASAVSLSDEQVDIAVERIAVPVIDAPRIAAMAGLYAGMATDPTAVPSVGTLWQLARGEAQATVEGIEVTRAGDARPAAVVERMAMLVSQDAAGSGRVGWDIQSLVLDYTQFGERAASVAAALGLDEQPIAMTMRSSTDAAVQRSTLDRLRLDVGRALGIEASGEVGTVPPTELGRRMNILTYAIAAAQAPLRHLMLKIEDGGLVGRAVRLWAAMSKVSVDEAVTRLRATASTTVQPWRTRLGESRVDGILTAVEGFLRLSGSLTVTLTPRQPMSIATVAAAGALQPELLLDGVDVVHVPPPGLP